jgi:hypothetical protein
MGPERIIGVEKKTLLLPIAVVSPTDIARLVRETENLDEFFRQSAIRDGGTPQSAPRYSRLLDELVVANSMNLLQTEDRTTLLDLLHGLAKSAPILHISFSVDPPGPYVQKIVNWLRQNIHPSILVRVGLQPNIGAGCVVRTANKSFDFSLRKFFDSKHEFFMQKLHEVVSEGFEEQPVAEAEAVVTVDTVEQPALAQPSGAVAA